MSNQEVSSSFSMTPVWMLVAVYVIALADMPYGYYMITRLITCGMALWLLWRLYLLKPKGDGLLWVLGVVAVLYNPLVPIYLNSKALWTIINIFTIGLFWFSIQSGERLSSARTESHL